MCIKNTTANHRQNFNVEVKVWQSLTPCSPQMPYSTLPVSHFNHILSTAICLFPNTFVMLAFVDNTAEGDIISLKDPLGSGNSSICLTG